MKRNNHILYSYRRCPYAMRARMALIAADVQCDVHDIDFKNKPEAMLDISPKGTVPVLHTVEDVVIDESMDIIHWALNDNHALKQCDTAQAEALISINDGSFKRALDRYKYPNRFPDEDCSNAREQGVEILEDRNIRLQNTPYLLGDSISYADMAIFPFVRQFANIDRAWFDALPLPALQNWLKEHLESDLFKQVFAKQESNPYSLIP